MHTKGRNGKQTKSITVTSNDPNQPTIRLNLIATVEVEISVEPMTVYFRDIKKGEKSCEKVSLQNTSSQPLKITSFEGRDEMVDIDLLNHTPDLPLELKPSEKIELVVGFSSQFDKPRYSKQITIKYEGGKTNEAYFRIYATQETEPQTPEEGPAAGQSPGTPQPQRVTHPQPQPPLPPKQPGQGAPPPPLPQENDDLKDNTKTAP